MRSDPPGLSSGLHTIFPGLYGARKHQHVRVISTNPDWVGVPFAAISYFWGGKKRNSINNIHQEHLALRGIHLNISKPVRDAVCVTRRLGIQ